jgi:hypothetical protein
MDDDIARTHSFMQNMHAFHTMTWRDYVIFQGTRCLIVIKNGIELTSVPFI